MEEKLKQLRKIHERLGKLVGDAEPADADTVTNALRLMSNALDGISAAAIVTQAAIEALGDAAGKAAPKRRKLKQSMRLSDDERARRREHMRGIRAKSAQDKREAAADRADMERP